MKHIPSPTQHSPPATPFDTVSTKKEKRYQTVGPHANLSARADKQITVAPQAKKHVIIGGKPYCNGETVGGSLGRSIANFPITTAPPFYTAYDCTPKGVIIFGITVCRGETVGRGFGGHPQFSLQPFRPLPTRILTAPTPNKGLTY